MIMGERIVSDKKYTHEEVIEFLDDRIDSAQININYCERTHTLIGRCEEIDCVRNRYRKEMLTKIKGIVEAYPRLQQSTLNTLKKLEKFKSQPDGDLVEKINYMDILIMEEDPYEIHTFIPMCPSKKRRFELLKEIRKLLQSRRLEKPSITREEISLKWDDGALGTVGEIVDLFKSKDIEVRNK